MRAIAAAGGNLNIVIAGVARLRGSCERVFRTINQSFLPLLSGRTFWDVVERGAYDSEANAVHTIDDLTNMLIRFVVDVYHETARSSLGGLSPREMWDHLADGAGLGVSVDLLIEDLIVELADRPYDVASVADAWMLRTRPAYAAAIRTAADFGEQDLDLREYDVMVLAAIAYH